jgi:putative zinc finger protein
MRVDRVLSTANAAALDVHLDACSDCRVFAERLDASWRVLHVLDDRVTAPDDWATVERAIDAKNRWIPESIRWRFAPVPAAAAWAFVAVAAVGLAGGALVSRAALGPQRTAPIEASMFAETLGDLPWASPAAGLGHVLDGRFAKENKP